MVAQAKDMKMLNSCFGISSSHCKCYHLYDNAPFWIVVISSLIPYGCTMVHTSHTTRGDITSKKVLLARSYHLALLFYGALR